MTLSNSKQTFDLSLFVCVDDRLQEEQLRQRDEAERMQREQQQKQEELDSLRARATAALPMEPQAQVQGGVIKVQLRFPGGLKASRRFLFENSLQVTTIVSLVAKQTRCLTPFCFGFR